jgi:hypothetical protein
MHKDIKKVVARCALTRGLPPIAKLTNSRPLSNIYPIVDIFSRTRQNVNSLCLVGFNNVLVL